MLVIQNNTENWIFMGGIPLLMSVGLLASVALIAWHQSLEKCDGIDNDHDGLVDEMPESAPADADGWYLDSDGDGFGDRYKAKILRCPTEEASVRVPRGGDCDDHDPLVIPGQGCSK